ncbi:hypothetical protein COOONC_27697 [Cooperia oncophora]
MSVILMRFNIQTASVAVEKDESPTKVPTPASAPESPDKSGNESSEGDLLTLLNKVSPTKTVSPNGTTPSTESASRDVLLGILNVMDEFEATRKTTMTIFDDEVYLAIIFFLRA